MERDTPHGTIAPHGPAAFGADGGMPDLSQRAVRRASGLDAHLWHDQRIWLEAAETIDAQILTVPMAVALKAAHDAYVKALIILAGTFAIVFIVMNLLLHYAIVAPVKRSRRWRRR